MLLKIPEVLTPAQVSECRKILEAADWVDGKVTAGYQSAKAKNNMQLPEDSPAAQELGEVILNSLQKNNLFIAAALPLKVFPPLFNSYGGGQSFGTHIDNAIRQVKNLGLKVRTDLSATIFLSDPLEYDGGELVVEDTYGMHKVKLPAGHMILYPASSLHHVRPVVRGTRLASFFWIESMVRDDFERTILFDLDNAIQKVGEGAAAIQLTGIYHNLLRKWANT